MTVHNDVRGHTTDLHCIVFETMSFRSEVQVHVTQADQDEYV